MYAREHTSYFGTGTRIRTRIEGFGDPYSTIELYPYFGGDDGARTHDLRPTTGMLTN